MSTIQEVRVPEPDLTPDEVVHRARALREQLRDEQAATEERTFHSDELHGAFEAAGFYRILQPRRFGGYEFSVRTFYEVIVEIARGCPSTGWCLCLAAGHALQAGTLFTEDVQRDIFGPEGDFRAPSRFVPMGTATPTGGGWVIDGQWDFCSGSPYSTHFLPSVVFPPERPDAPPTFGVAMVPRSGWERLDDWGDMLGLRGSGSHSIRVDKAEVPQGWVVPVEFRDVQVPSQTPGGAIHGNPMYAARPHGFFAGELTAVAVGLAYAALDDYEHALHTKITTFTRIPRWKDELFREHYGIALGQILSAEAILMQVADLQLEYAKRGFHGGEPFSLADDTGLALMTNRAGDLVFQAVDRIVRTTGASGQVNGQRMQRYWRDLTMFRGHMAMHLEMHAANAGGIRLELAH
jgi:3-hydroxy-9,10-secoandrosta-1,3,5(10)-triene-9,17-dione monooxygenase